MKRLIEIANELEKFNNHQPIRVGDYSIFISRLDNKFSVSVPDYRKKSGVKKDFDLTKAAAIKIIDRAIKRANN